MKRPVGLRRILEDNIKLKFKETESSVVNKAMILRDP
jgi:hypothetical protein